MNSEKGEIFGAVKAAPYKSAVEKMTGKFYGLFKVSGAALL